MKISKITLGTAQIGLNYGISNLNGKPKFNESIELLNYAWQNGINCFDTSPQYGNSEEIIGSFISSKNRHKIQNPIIISKLPKIKRNKNLTFSDIYGIVKTQITQSLGSLKIQRIPIYLLHHPSDIFIKDGLIFDCLDQIKKEGLIERFGTSIYAPEEVEAILNFKNVDAIQVPINLFDHRLIKTELLKELKKRGYLIFARSIYLQGLLFIHPHKLPKEIKYAKVPLLKLQKIVKEYKTDTAKLAFLFVRDLPEITSLVIGVENINQLKQNLNLLDKKPLQDKIRQGIFDEFSDLPEELINPNLWN